MRSRTRTLLALLVASALFFTACGDDDSGGVATSGDATEQDGGPSSTDDDTGEGTEDAEDDGATAFPVSVTSGSVETTVEARPEAIVSLSPTATEMLFALGAGDQVVAVDELSNFPADAPVTDLSGFEPNVEAIAEYEPDLVVLSDDRNDVISALQAVDVPALVLPAAAVLDDTYAQIETLGTVTGNVDGADDLVGQMQSDIEDLVAQVPERDEPPTYYHELDDTLYSITSSTFIGEIYSLAGLENVADAADPEGESFGYPQLSAEFLIDADPDLIFLADTKCCGQSIETVSQRPGFDQLTAVQQGNVIELDDDIASRWGPRVVDFLAAVVDATVALEPAA